MAGFGVLRVLGLMAALLSMLRDYPAVLTSTNPFDESKYSVLDSANKVLLLQLQFGVVAVGVLWAMSAYWFALLLRGLIAVVLVRVHKKEVSLESSVHYHQVVKDQ